MATKKTTTQKQASSKKEAKAVPTAATLKKKTVATKKGTASKKSVTPVKEPRTQSKKVAVSKKVISPKKTLKTKGSKGTSKVASTSKKIVTSKKSTKTQLASSSEKKPVPAKGSAKKTGEIQESSETRKVVDKIRSTLNARGKSPSRPSADARSLRPHVFTLEDVEEILNSQKGSHLERKVTPPVSKGAHKSKETKTHKVEEIPVPKKQSHAAASLEDILGFNPVENKKMEDIVLETIPPKFQRYYKDLQKLRAQVKETLEYHTEETLNRSAKEDSGDLSGYGQHQADAGTDTYDRDYALSLVSDGQALLSEIEEAIKRISNGTYGICEVTGKPINKERLKAVPFARYSLEGQIEYEKTRRRQFHRGGIFDSSLEESPTFEIDDNGDE